MQTRIDNAISYVRSHIDPRLAEEMTALIAGHPAISDEISLGPFRGFLSSCAAPLAQQREALRALLLCQRIYLSALWPSLMDTPCRRVARNHLPANWRSQTLRYWGNRSEEQIRESLRMFVATSNDPALVADEAQKEQPSAPQMFLTCTRRTLFGGRAHCCYSAVMLWLFKSGLVSLRWLLKFNGANTREALTEAFGPGLIIWSGTLSETQSLPPVPRGHIIHMYQDQSGWLGHWMVSVGNGKAAGVNNNDETPMVPRVYWPQLTLDKQLRAYGAGRVSVINPTDIPGRA